jgi:membrane protease YdiL (CAAX protease family)
VEHPKPYWKNVMGNPISFFSRLPIGQKRNWVEIFLVAGLIFGINLGGGLLVFFSPKAFRTFVAECGSWYFLLQIAQELFLLGLTWHIIRLRGETLKDFSRPARKKDILIGLGLWLGALFFFFLSYFFLSKFFPFILTAGRSLDLQNPWKPSLGLFIFGLVNPFYEEGLIRGFFQTRWRQLGLPVWVGALLCALKQTSYHIYYGLGVCLSMFLGFQIWAVYYARFGRLWPLVFAHLFGDLLPTLLL